MTMTITESRVEERLQPQPSAFTPLKKATKHSTPYSLMRSASFDRLRQFPTYFCRNGSTEIYRWLFSSKNKVVSSISEAAKQVQQLLLTVSVFGAVGIVLAQLAACVVTIISEPLPFGLNFLLTCVLIMATLASQIFIIPKPLQRKPRSQERRVKKD